MRMQPPNQPPWDPAQPPSSIPSSAPILSSPPRKPRRKIWLILAITSGVLVLACITCGVIGSFVPKQPQAAGVTPTTAVQVTHVATKAPTNTPTPKPTIMPSPTPTHPAVAKSPVAKLAATYGTPRIGGPLSDFVGKYGQPDTGCMSCQQNVYNFQRWQGTELDYISQVLTDANGNVSSFDVSTPPESDWDPQTAAALCETFGPVDANYDRSLKTYTSSDGAVVEKVYQSATLAGQLQASDFTDGYSGNDITPGTFDITYTEDGSASQIADCSLEAGTQGI